MKIRVLEECPHRVSSGRSIHFKVGEYDNVAKSIADELIKAGKAKALNRTKPKIIKKEA